MTTQQALNKLNANPCTAWDQSLFIGFSSEQIEAAKRAWHAALYAAAIAFSTPSK